MATVNPSVAFVGNDTVKFSWALTNANGDGAPVGPNHADYADRNVQLVGTLGGATIVLQGSNDGGTTWYSLDDPQGNDLSFTAAGGKAISEVPELTRPLLTGGAGSSVTVLVMARRSRGVNV